MDTGKKISGAAHGGLILWVILGGTLFRSEPAAELHVAEVTLMSSEEFAALGERPPEAATAVSDPTAPEIIDDTAGLPEPQERPDPAPADAPEAPQDPEETPDVAAVRERPVTEAEDRAPEVPEPPAAEDVAVLAPEPESAPRPAERVAPVPSPEPERDVPRADTPSEATAPTPDAPAEAETEPETAPDAAATEIVTEAEETDSLAPERVQRPRQRPERPRPQPVETARDEPETPAEPETPSEDDIAAAIAADIADDAAPQGGAPEPAAQSGPPLTGGERDRLRLAVQECWNVGALSSDALRVVVTVGVSLNRDGTPQVETIRKISESGGSGGAARQAYEAARRAIIRCGARGFDLPAAKYDRWRDIEMTFNPETMRIR